MKIERFKHHATQCDECNKADAEFHIEIEHLACGIVSLCGRCYMALRLII